MAKTLSESAAEILQASMAAAGKEPAVKASAEVVDLGGATTENPGGDNVGSKAAAAVGVAAKPGTEGAPAEPAKKAPAAEVVADADKALLDTLAAAKTVKEEAATEESTEETVEVDAEEVEVDTISEEEIVEAKKTMMKDMVAKHKGTMKEDVDALFNGESLSEEFRVKATLIFEAAVQSRVEKIVEEVLSDNDEILAEAYEEIKTELSEQVDEYLNYVVEEWVKDNEVAIETGLRAELVDDFISGLKNLFAEHYIEIPDEKIDVAEELAAKVAELEESASKTAEELSAKVSSLTEELNAVKKEKAIRLACEGLTEVQAGKMKSLAESVEFTAEGDFANKLAVIRENYFPSKVQVKSEVKELQETTVTEEPEVAEVHGIMAHYVKALSKTAPKA